MSETQMLVHDGTPRALEIVKATAIDVQIASQLEGEVGVWCAHAKSDDASYVVLAWKSEPPCVYELRGGSTAQRKLAFAHTRDKLKERLDSFP